MKRALVVVLLVLLPTVFRAESDSVSVDSLLDLAWQVRKGQRDSARAYVERAYQMAVSQGYNHGMARSRQIRGILFRYEGDLLRARAEFEGGLKLAQSSGEQLLASSLLDNLALMARSEGNYAEALKLHLRSVKLLDSLGVREKLTRPYNGLAILYDIQKQPEKAKSYYEKSLAIHREFDNRAGMARTWYNLGNLHYNHGFLQAAVTAYEEAVGLQNELDDPARMANLYNSLGLVYSELDQFDFALDAYRESLRLHREMNNPSALIRVHNNLGLIYRGQGNWTAAFAQYDTALTMARQDHEAREEAEILLNLANAYHAHGDAEAAYRHMEQHNELRDSLFNVDRSREIAEIREEFETEKRQKQIAYLETQQQLTDAEIQQKTWERNALYLGVGLLAVILLGIVYYYRQKIKTREALSAHRDAINRQEISQLLQNQELNSINALMEGQEIERKRIAEDLHDRLGSMLSTVKLHFNAMNIHKTENRQQFNQANHLLDEACEEVRKIAHNMVSGVLTKFGLVPALEGLRDTIVSTNQLQMQVIAVGLDNRLDNQMEIEIYRMIQELIGNLLKHAQAHEVTIQLTRQNGNLNVLVEDDGQGFDPEAVRKGSGLGLRNVERRVARLSGSMSIDSRIGHGTTVTLDLPIQYHNN